MRCSLCHLIAADLYASFHDKMVTYDRGDHLHLNVEGNTLVAKQVISAIEPYL